jgi:hypothetical protein
LEDGGVEMSIVSPSDNNSYTTGNSLNINLTGIFMNPSPSLLQFDITIFSEENENTFDQFDFDIDCETNTIDTFESSHSLYPNPTSSFVNFGFEGVKTVRIIDMRGQLITSFKTSSEQIDVKNLSSGLYFVEIETDGNRIVDRLIVR